MIKEAVLSDLKIFNIDEINSPYRRYFGYFDNEELLGYLSIDYIYDRIEIVNIFVKSSCRNRKIGSSMIEYLIMFGKSLNITNITLEVKEDNIYAIKLYEKYGFRKVAIRGKYYGDKNGILMELIL